jgi:fatty-acyl-CoA synthase
VQTTAGPTYIERIIGQLTRAGNRRPVLNWQGRDLSAADFLFSIYTYAGALSSLGIGRGSLVALLAPNCPDAIAVRYAAHLLGAGACYLSAPRFAEARARLIQQIDPSLLVILPETLHLLPTGTGIRTVAVGDCGPDVPQLEQLATSQRSVVPACQARPSELAVIASSGGSTGVPKGSCRNFSSYTRMVDVHSRPDRRQLVNGRLAYLSQVLVDVTLLGGGFVVLRDAFDPTDTLAQIEEQRITDLFLVEPQLFELMDHPDIETRDLSCLRSLVHVGASAPPALRRRARKRFGAVIAHTYGASEQGLVSQLSASEHDPSIEERWSCAGRLLPGVELRLRKSDGTLADTNQPGAIEVRSPAMAQGYRNRPDLTVHAFADGWYHSGDLGFLDGGGYLHVLGRAEDIAIGTKGLIIPTALEDTLCGLPSVKYAFVVVDQELGTRTAAVVPWPRSAVDSAQCLLAVSAAHGTDVAESLIIVEVERLPVTEQGKPDRQIIQSLGRLHGERRAVARRPASSAISGAHRASAASRQESLPLTDVRVTPKLFD